MDINLNVTGTLGKTLSTNATLRRLSRGHTRPDQLTQSASQGQLSESEEFGALSPAGVDYMSMTIAPWEVGDADAAAAAPGAEAEGELGRSSASTSSSLTEELGAWGSSVGSSEFEDDETYLRAKVAHKRVLKMKRSLLRAPPVDTEEDYELVEDTSFITPLQKVSILKSPAGPRDREPMPWALRMPPVLMPTSVAALIDTSPNQPKVNQPKVRHSFYLRFLRNHQIRRVFQFLAQPHGQPLEECLCRRSCGCIPAALDPGESVVSRRQRRRRRNLLSRGEVKGGIYKKKLKIVAAVHSNDGLVGSYRSDEDIKAATHPRHRNIAARARICFFMMCHSRLYELAMLAVILLSFIFINSPWSTTESRMEVAFMIIFGGEMVLKIACFGIVRHKGAYFRSWWNVLDACMVVLQALVFANGFGNFTVFRLLRVLRPLRSLKFFRDLHVVVKALLQSLKGLLLVGGMSVMMFFIAATVAIQLWSGRLLVRCANVEDGTIYDQMFCRTDGYPFGDIPQAEKQDILLSYTNDPIWLTLEFRGSRCPAGLMCTSLNGAVENPGKGHISFDNILSALLIVFDVATFERWEEMLFYCYHISGPMSIIYFFVLILVSSYFIPNLILAVINERFSVALRISNRRKLTHRILVELERRAALDNIIIVEADAPADASGNQYAPPPSGEDEPPILSRSPSTRSIQPAGSGISRHVADNEDAGSSSICSGIPPSRKNSMLARAAMIDRSEVVSRASSIVSRLSPVARLKQMFQKKDPILVSRTNSFIGRPPSPALSPLELTERATRVSLASSLHKLLLKRGEHLPMYKRWERLRNTFHWWGEGCPRYEYQLMQVAEVYSDNWSTFVDHMKQIVDKLDQQSHPFPPEKPLGGPPSSSSGSEHINVAYEADDTEMPTVRSDEDPTPNDLELSAGPFELHIVSSPPKLSPTQEPHIPAVPLRRNSLARSTQSRSKRANPYPLPPPIPNVLTKEEYTSRCKEHRVMPWLSLAVGVAIIVNVLILCLHHHNEPEWITNVVDYTNYGFIAIFAIEFIIRVVALGPWRYMKDFYLAMDFIILVVCGLELGLDGSSNYSALRALRLLRVFKLLHIFESMRYIVDILFSVFSHAGYLLLLLLVFELLESLVAVQIFTTPLSDANDRQPFVQFSSEDNFFLASNASNNAGLGPLQRIYVPSYNSTPVASIVSIQQLSDNLPVNVGNTTVTLAALKYTLSFVQGFSTDSGEEVGVFRVKASFDDTLHSFFAVFQVLTSDGWTQLLQAAMQTGASPVGSAIYFVILVFVGNTILVSMFLAMLVASFAEASRLEDEQAKQAQLTQAREYGHASMYDDDATFFSLELFLKKLRTTNFRTTTYGSSSQGKVKLTLEHLQAIQERNEPIEPLFGPSRTAAEPYGLVDGFGDEVWESSSSEMTGDQPVSEHSSHRFNIVLHEEAPISAAIQSTLNLQQYGDEMVETGRSRARRRRRKRLGTSCLGAVTEPSRINGSADSDDSSHNSLLIATNDQGFKPIQCQICGMNIPQSLPPPPLVRPLRGLEQHIHNGHCDARINRERSTHQLLKVLTRLSRIEIQMAADLTRKQLSLGLDLPAPAYTGRDGIPVWSELASMKLSPGLKSILSIVTAQETRHGVFFNATSQSSELKDRFLGHLLQREGVDSLSEQLRRNADGAVSDASLEFGNESSVREQNEISGGVSFFDIPRSEDGSSSSTTTPSLMPGPAPESPAGQVMSLQRELAALESVRDVIEDRLFLQRRLDLGCEFVGGALKATATAGLPKADMDTGKTLYIFEPSNPIRRAATYIFDSHAVEYCIMVCIVGSCVLLVLSNPRTHWSTAQKAVITYLDLGFTLIFAIHIVCGTISRGLFWGPHSFLRDPWKVLDVVVVALSLVVFSIPKDLVGVGAGRSLKGLKALKALLPLQLVTHIRGLRIVTATLLRSLMGLCNVGLLALTNLIVFAIIGIDLFGGKLYHCSDPSVVNRDDCVGEFSFRTFDHLDSNITLGSAPRRWMPYRRNFDNIGSALLTLLEVAVGESWSDTLYDSIGVVSESHAPTADAHPEYGAYFIVFYLITDLIFLNLFVAVVVYNFGRVKNSIDDLPLMTTNQMAWVETQRIFYHFKPTPGLIRPMKLHMHTFQYVVRRACFEMVNSPFFVPIEVMGILMNAAVLAMEYEQMSSTYEATIDALNQLFTCIFILEVVVKLIAYKPRPFWSRRWFRYDACLAILSVVDLGIWAAGTPHEDLGVFHLIRVLRLLRLFEMSTKTSILLETIVFSIPALGNVFVLLIVLFFIYAVLGNQLFSHVKPGVVLDDVFVNFYHVGNSMQLLFIFSTGELWNHVMHDCMVETPVCGEYDTNGQLLNTDNCGTPGAPVYFISFVCITIFVLVNVFVEIVIVNYNTTKRLSKGKSMRSVNSKKKQLKKKLQKSSGGVIAAVGLGRSRNLGELKQFTQAWSTLDPSATLLIPTFKLLNLLALLPPPLGFSSSVFAASCRKNFLRHLRDHLTIVDRCGYVHFSEVLIPMARSILDSHLTERELRHSDELWKDRIANLNRLPVVRVRQSPATVEMWFAATFIGAAVRGWLVRKHLKKGRDGEVPIL